LERGGNAILLIGTAKENASSSERGMSDVVV
jgi:hypothetical protein